jgi:predicted metal-dependent hydrolase
LATWLGEHEKKEEGRRPVFVSIFVEHELYLRAVVLFNEATFFEAHEAWEDVWRPAVGPEKKFLQGLIQVAVAFHHHSKGNVAGARSLLERGNRNLTGYPEDFGGIRLGELRQSLEQWRHALDEGKPVPPLPRI